MMKWLHLEAWMSPIKSRVLHKARCCEREQPQDRQGLISRRAEHAGGYWGMKAEFQREFKEINQLQQPELDGKELKWGHLPSLRSLPQGDQSERNCQGPSDARYLFQDLLVDKVLHFGASLTPRLPDRTKQVETVCRETEPQPPAGRACWRTASCPPTHYRGRECGDCGGERNPMNAKVLF